MAQKELAIILKLKDEATQAMQKAAGSFDDFQKRANPLVPVLKGVAVGMTAVGGAALAFGGMAIRAAAEMEQMRIGFTTMLGSAQKADAFLRDMVKFAKTTPFELKGLQEAAQRLLAYGSAQEEVLPQLKMLGDISAGVGMDKLPQLILAFGQVQAATRLTGMELRQFTEAGVPLLDTLAKQMGVTVAQVQEMVSTGQIGFSDVQAALAGLTGEGGRFNNLMENQSKSLNGMISNLKDAWNIFLTGEGQKLLEWAKQFIGLAITIVENVLPKFVAGIDSVVNAFTGFLAWTGLLHSGLGGLFQSIDEKTGLVTALKMAWDDVSTVFRENLLPELQKLWEAMQPLMPYLVAFAEVLGTTVILALHLLIKALEGVVIVVTELLSWFTKLATFLTDVWVKTIETITRIMEPFVSLLDRVIGALSSVSSLASSVGASFRNLPANLGFGGARAEGGSVRSGMSYLVGERGPELFTPGASGRITPNGALGGGVTVNLNVGSIDSRLDAKEIALTVGEEIMKQMKLNMRLVHDSVGFVVCLLSK